MSDHLSRASRGGYIASRIDQQDGVAVLLMLMAACGHLGFPREDFETASISFEVYDDISLHYGERSHVVSVKTSPMDKAALSSEFSRLKSRESLESSRLILAIVGAETGDSVSLRRSLEEIQSLSAAPDGVSAVKKWAQSNPGFPDPLTCSVVHFPERDTQEFLAQAVRFMRMLVPLMQYTDTVAEVIIDGMLDACGRLRRRRGTTEVRELFRPLSELAVPAVFAFGSVDGYVKTRYGYLRDSERRGREREEALRVAAAQKEAMGRYRRATRGFRLRAMALGPIRCISCGGPLMANMYGYTGPGLACSHCGFNPYCTILAACDNGHPNLVVAQPDIDQVSLMLRLAECANTKCDQCDATFAPETLMMRIFQLNIPWPPESFSEKSLIAAREEVGLHGAGGVGPERLISEFPAGSDSGS